MLNSKISEKSVRNGFNKIIYLGHNSELEHFIEHVGFVHSNSTHYRVFDMFNILIHNCNTALIVGYEPNIKHTIYPNELVLQQFEHKLQSIKIDTSFRYKIELFEIIQDFVDSVISDYNKKEVA